MYFFEDKFPFENIFSNIKNKSSNISWDILSYQDNASQIDKISNTKIQQNLSSPKSLS